MKSEQKILKMLKENPEDFVSGEGISEALNISRTMVWKHVNALRDTGYQIESATCKGYMLKGIPDLLLPAEIEKGLKTEFVGRKIHHFDELTSTNLKSKEIATDSQNGTVVVAEKQSEGRGRMGKAWASPPGGIYLSIILKPEIPPDHIHRLTLVAGVAAVEVLNELGLNAEIKWPNDILINEKKVCGILTEIDAEADAVNYVIIGIGVNANTKLDALPPLTLLQATSLKEEMGQGVDRVSITQRFLERFEQHYVTFSEGGFPRVLKHWREHSSTIGRRVKLATKFRTIVGEAVGIDHDGALIVELDDGTVVKEITGTCFHQTFHTNFSQKFDQKLWTVLTRKLLTKV